MVINMFISEFKAHIEVEIGLAGLGAVADGDSYGTGHRVQTVA